MQDEHNSAYWRGLISSHNFVGQLKYVAECLLDMVVNSRNANEEEVTRGIYEEVHYRADVYELELEQEQRVA